jgi:PTS system ascorbate-specific IIA component
MSLNEMLGQGAVALDVACADWREAVREAGRLLVASGVATDDYTDQMIDTVERLGPYIVIAPGLALAHSRPSEAVLRTGMSWLRPAEPVEFGHRTNDPVTLVVGLAATDHEQHQTALVELATLFSDEQRRRQLTKLPDPAVLREFLGATGREEQLR